jgi:hypothetical protein
MHHYHHTSAMQLRFARPAAYNSTACCRSCALHAHLLLRYPVHSLLTTMLLSSPAFPPLPLLPPTTHSLPTRCCPRPLCSILCGTTIGATSLTSWTWP